jgi:hypothetical protein
MAIIDDVLVAAAGGRPSFDEWLDNHPNEVTPELAAALGVLAGQNIEKRELPRALHAYYAASRLLDKLGEPKQSLISSENVGQLLFSLATTPRQYATARGHVLNLVPDAEALGMRDRYVQLLVLAADCGYFAFEAAGSELEQTQWLEQSLKDLCNATSAIYGQEDIQASMPRFAGLTAVTFNRAASRDWAARGPDVANLLCALAAQAERWIPVPFVFQGDPERTRSTGIELARLSSMFGDAVLGARRRNCVKGI